MRKLFLIALLALFSTNISHAQRFTDELDRGVVAVNLNGQVFVSWRILPEEYYGTTYNLYKNGSLVQGNLSVSNWTGSGNSSDNFTVAAVVNGVEGKRSSVAKVWTKSGSNYQAGYIDFPLQPVLDRNHEDKTHHYMPNDAIFADLDGDGQLDMIVKRVNRYDAEGYYTGQKEVNPNDNKEYEIWMEYPEENITEFTIWDAYKLDWQTGSAERLWWIDCGPNMVYTNNTENNLLAYDWDMDSKAEVMMRGCDNMYFHTSDGRELLIGTTANIRGEFNHHSSYWNQVWTKSGKEYLIYFNGETGVPYQYPNVMEYPLKRYENGETNLNTAWPGSKDYGHISSKYFIGAPYLDGRKPSVFLGRGIYGRHKMIALDVDPQTHALAQRWEWHSIVNGVTPGSYWYGNGNHNYVIADVDEDGRDEIIYGNMVIDDNGKGLNSTGFGHGDAMHVNDFDPYRKGLEIYNCIEDEPTWGMSYRSGLTGEIYKHFISNGDDGRALAGNFINDIPGSIGRTWHSTTLALSSDKYVSQYDYVFSNVGGGGRQNKMNYRIYWDGDLLSESFDGGGSSDDPNGRGGTIYKWNGSDTYRIIENVLGNTINGTKNNPSFQGDIIGDWREELVMRISGDQVTETHEWDEATGKTFTYTYFNTMRVTTSAISTEYPIYNLWGDHQYRQAMGTQMQCYNLPPNASFFLGEMEGITQAPPPLLNRGRAEVRNGGTISTSHNGKHVMLAEVGNAQIKVAEGANPKVFTDNAPWWVQGNNPSEAQGLIDASTTVYTHTLTGAPFTGETMLVKQGGGTLVLPGDEQTYTGDTKVWAGTLQYDGKMTNSNVWLNRFAALSSTGGEFKNVTAEYDAEIQPGGTAANVSEVTIENLTLGFGSRVVFDLNGKNMGDNDLIHVTNMTLETKTDQVWVNYGPENLKPVFQFNLMSPLPGGRYPIGTYVNSPQYALLSDIIVDGIDASRNPTVLVDGGIIYLEINDMPVTSEPEIAIIDMVQTNLTDLYPSSTPTSYYMPKVGVTVAGNSSGVKPTLSGEFTDLNGHVTTFQSKEATEYCDIDYYTHGSVSDWTPQNDQISISLEDGYISLKNSSGRGTRWFRWDLSKNTNKTVTDDLYTIEFDADLGMSNTNDNGVELVIFGNTAATNNQDPGMHMFSGTNYIFRIAGGINGGAYTVTTDNNTIDNMTNGHWYHFYIAVDQINKTVEYEIKSNGTTIDSGNYSVASVSTGVKGIFVSQSRNGSPKTKIDNIKIESPATNFSEFTFKKPGTLRVTATGDASTTPNFKTFTVENPYVKLGAGEDYYVETFDGLSSVPSRWHSPNAGSGLKIINNDYLDFNLDGISVGASRNAYCDLATNNNKINITSDIYTVDFDAKLTPGNDANYKNQIALLSSNSFNNNAEVTTGCLFSAVVGGNSTEYTVATSGNKLISIPSNIWCHYHFIVNKNNQTISWAITKKVDNSLIGEATDNIPQNMNMDITYIHLLAGRSKGACSIDNIYISEYTETGLNPEYLPVSIHDELLTDLPNAVTDGNAHIWRNGLNTTTTWASLVLPFDMTSDQITEVFGENTQVANLVTDMGNATQLYFETDSRTIHANQPVLIKDVSNPAPYLVMDISSNPIAVPVVQNAQFQYIGNYDNKGSMPFYHNVDYFFSNNKLSTVKTDGTYMTLKGYRGYFHANDGAEATISVLFDDPSGVRDITTAAPKTFNVYSLSGQIIRRNATSLQGLTRGIYIVNGKKYLVK